MLAFPNYKLLFTPCTDASAHCVGAVLIQTEYGRRPQFIAFASRVLNSAKSMYPVTYLEALAVIWALKHFSDIMYNYPITVYIDHTAVTQLFNSKNITGRLARWYLTVQKINPTIKYLPYRENAVPDALSRNIPVAVVPQVSNFSNGELSQA